MTIGVDHKMAVAHGRRPLAPVRDTQTLPLSLSLIIVILYGAVKATSDRPQRCRGAAVVAAEKEASPAHRHAREGRRSQPCPVRWSWRCYLQ